MIPIETHDDQTDYLNIKLQSEAFEGGVPSFYQEKPDKYYEDISEVHKVLYRMDKKARPLSINIEYKPISNDFLTDVVELHNEWFPFSYDRNYFRKYILRHNNVAIGAFLKLGIKEYLVGCVIGEIIHEQKFRNYLPGVLVERSWYDFFSSWVNCGYLHSLGVIDEYRKLSVGTKLLEMFIEEMKKRNCVAIYLNIIEHNNAAIKFIEANNWHFYGISRKYYRYNEKLYNARVYYYVLDMIWLNSKDSNNTKNINNNNENTGIEELNSNQRGCWQSLFGYFGGNSDDNNDKKEQEGENKNKNQISSSEDSK